MDRKSHETLPLKRLEPKMYTNVSIKCMLYVFNRRKDIIATSSGSIHAPKINFSSDVPFL